MRKVELSLKENYKYKIIKKLVETNGNKERARIKLGLKSIRQINRLIAGYKQYGKEFFVHGNRGRKPKHALSSELKDEIELLYTSKYFDCTYTQFTEYLSERENIFLSTPEVGQILREKYILSPRSRKITKKNIKKKFALVAISVAIGSMATGCNQNINSNQYINENNGIYQQLNEEKLDSNTTDINDRADYYEKYVEDKMDKMSESEKLNYYVNVKVNYIGRENYDDDDIIFLRNDNVYKGDLYDGDDSIGLPPGIYRVISEKVDGHQSSFGEISILTPGEDVTLNVDYNSYKASISSDEKTK